MQAIVECLLVIDGYLNEPTADPDYDPLIFCQLKEKLYPDILSELSMFLISR